MLVRSDDLERLNSIVWQGWSCACDAVLGVAPPPIDPDLVPVGIQPSIAEHVIGRNGG
jgi:hypothetical protein